MTSLPPVGRGLPAIHDSLVGSPMAHMGLAGSRHMIPERLPSRRSQRETAVGLRVGDLNPDTVRNIQNLGPSLKRLDLSHLQLKIIPEDVISSLSRLERLDVNSNSLTGDSFPPNLRDLAESLIELSAHDNQLAHIPTVVRKLRNLTRLKLSENKLQKLDGLEKLKKLQMLILDNNEIACLSAELCAASKKVQVLHLGDNILEIIPREIRHLRHLCDLNLSNNNLTSLPPEVFLLPRLEFLNASGNQISRVPTINAKGRHKQKLVSIDLSNNALIKFPGHLMFMTKKLDLSQNRIKVIPISLIDKLDQVANLDLQMSDNPMSNPPPEVCDCGLKSILQFFVEMRTTMKVYQGLKVLVLGAADQGKTSLVQTLVDQQPRLSEQERTSGIDIFDHIIDQDEDNPTGKYLSLSLWDFSGSPRDLFQHSYFIQPSLVFLVFNMADYDESRFRTLIAFWIDYVIARCNRLVMIPVGTHADRLKPAAAARVCQSVSQGIERYIEQYRASIQREIKRIESKAYISPALSEQLKMYVNLTKLQTTVHPAVIPVSCSAFTGMDALLKATQRMAEDKDAFPNVMRVIPSLWAEVENYVDDRGFAMSIPMLPWEEYKEEVTAKFGMRHLMTHITEYLHDVGKVLWFHDHPTLKDFVFLRPSWLLDIFKSLYRQDVNEVDYNMEESCRQLGVTPAKVERMKAELAAEGQAEKDLLRCLWAPVFQTDFNKPVFEIIALLVDHFQVGYAVAGKTASGRAQATASASNASLRSLDRDRDRDRGRDRPDSVRSSRGAEGGSDTPSVRFQLGKNSSSSSLNNASGASPGRRSPTKSSRSNSPASVSRGDLAETPIRIWKILIPWLRDTPQPASFRDEYREYLQNTNLAAVFRFPSYIPPGFFEMLTVRAMKPEYDLTRIHHWRSGLYATHQDAGARFYLLRIDHENEGGTCLRVEVRNEEREEEEEEREEREAEGKGVVHGEYRRSEDSDNDENEGDRSLENLWKVLLPFLKEVEDLASKYAGIRLERYMECPLCHALSFLGEWLTPKDLQGAATKACEYCKKDVPTKYLVQPKEKRRIEEFLLQKLMQEAEKRRQGGAAADDTKPAADSRDVTPDATGDISDVRDAASAAVNQSADRQSSKGKTTLSVVTIDDKNSSERSISSAGSSRSHEDKSKSRKTPPPSDRSHHADQPGILKQKSRVDRGPSKVERDDVRGSRNALKAVKNEVKDPRPSHRKKKAKKPTGHNGRLAKQSAPLRE